MRASEELYALASALIPGGVNSPVRAFRGVGGSPFFVARARGSRLWDVDGQSYIDYVGSWGPLIVGHAHPKVVEAIHAAAEAGTSYGAPTRGEVELARLLVDAVPSLEMVRLVNSGTEAVMSALRVARAHSGRDSYVMVEGGYHGLSDAFQWGIEDLEEGGGMIRPYGEGVPGLLRQLCRRVDADADDDEVAVDRAPRAAHHPLDAPAPPCPERSLP